MPLRLLILSLFLILGGGAFADDAVPMQQSIADFSDEADIAPVTKAELGSFYGLRGYRPAWSLEDEDAGKKITAFLNSIETLITYHGLIKDNYRLDLMRQLATSKSDADKQKLEFLITASLLHLAHDLHGDTVNLDALYTGWNFHRQVVDIPAQVNAAINAGSIGAYFDQAAPRHKMYTDLARVLQIYTEIAAKGGWKAIAAGAALHPHDRDPRIEQLRARLSAENYAVSAPAQGNDYFDDALSKTLIAYQDRNGLSPDGRLGAKTLEALNMPVAMRIMQIQANMERWRHMPDSFPPDRYTMVNIPDFSVAIVEDRNLIYRGIVIDGKPDRQTPFINSKIVNMLINPSWHVPVSIARKDILPKLRKDPHYLEKLGFVIARRSADPTGATIDWKHVKDEDFNYQLRQNPGDLNSLGQLKFNFSNSFDVYMHGTPHQELFDKAERDFSSGCVRLEDPVRVGEILLSHNKDKGGWNAQRIADTISAGDTLFVPLAKPMPIYFLYWSAFSDEDGQINFRKDIYGYDALLIDKMKMTSDTPGKEPLP